MTPGLNRRGQPLAVLTMVLGCWISARVMMWDASAMPIAALGRPAATAQAQVAIAQQQERVEDGVALAPAAVPAPQAAITVVPREQRSLGMAAHKLAGKLQLALVYAPADRPVVQSYAYAVPAAEPAAAPAVRGGQHWGRRPVPAKFAYAAVPRARGPIIVQQSFAPSGQANSYAPRMDAYAPGSSSTLASILFPTPPASPYVYNAGAAPAPQSRPHRWSVDGWYYWRRGSSTGISSGAFAPSYGASQVGGVLRYRIAPSSAYKPNIFLRSTAALNGSGEREVALGLSARPMPRAPIVIAGEARYSQTSSGKEVRPAGFAYTELPPFKLPLGLRGEAYAQGGYVGGRNATLFVDGSLRADHKLLQLGKPEVRLGGGIWGGAQKGAARMDAGPSLIVVTPLSSKVFARLAADWRFRVAGDAAPDSGPAVTLSAGF